MTTTLRFAEPVRYLNLCPKATQLQIQIDSAVGRRRKASYLLMEAEEQHPTRVETYRAELAQLKAEISDSRGVLMQHVAHCADGCVRDKSGGLSGSAYRNDTAPSHQKPPLPPMGEIAARLRNGEALEAIGLEYDRHPGTIGARLSAAGFSSRDGRPVTVRTAAAPAPPKRTLLDDEPWRADALCAQTDPESFFPEKGGSTREAKSVCTTCTVAAECLDYAIANDERFGIWGGLSERERRKLAKALRESTPTHLDTTQEAS